MTKKLSVPDWLDVSTRDHEGEELTALEKFVLDNEPAGIGEETAFREGLQSVIDELTASEPGAVVNCPRCDLSFRHQGGTAVDVIEPGAIHSCQTCGFVHNGLAAGSAPITGNAEFGKLLLEAAGIDPTSVKSEAALEWQVQCATCGNKSAVGKGARMKCFCGGVCLDIT